MHGHMHVNAGSCGDQRHWVTLELESHVVASSLMWVLRPRLRSSVRAASAPDS